MSPPSKPDGVPEKLWSLTLPSLGRGWFFPRTKGYAAMAEACADGAWLEASVGHHWRSNRRLLAAGYDLRCYMRRAGRVEQVISKDWDDDVLQTEVQEEAEARFVALRLVLARLLVLSASLGSPHLRIYTRDAASSGVIRPFDKGRLGVPERYQNLTGITRTIVDAYDGEGRRLFTRYPRRQREGTDTVLPAAYRKRFGRLQHRLRSLADPEQKGEALIVDLARVKRLLDAAQGEGRRPTLVQGIMHHLRDERRVPARVIADLSGVHTGQVNRAADAMLERQRALTGPMLTPRRGGRSSTTRRSGP